MVGHPEQLADADWEAIATPQAKPPKSWVIECLSPTALSSCHRYTPLLDSASLLGGLSRRWESLHGREGERSGYWLPRLTFEELGNVWVSSVSGRTVRETIPHFTGGSSADKVLPGFVGQVTLRCDEPMVASAVDCYLRFAEYAGVGALTTHGLGTVRVRRSW